MFNLLPYLAVTRQAFCYHYIPGLFYAQVLLPRYLQGVLPWKLQPVVFWYACPVFCRYRVFSPCAHVRMHARAARASRQLACMPRPALARRSQRLSATRVPVPVLLAQAHMENMYVISGMTQVV